MGLMHVVSLLCVISVNLWAISAALDTYIVHVESPQSHGTQNSVSNEDLDIWYQSFLPTKTSAPNDDEVSPQIVHSYHYVFSGFSAKLSAEDVKAMEEKPGFISAAPEGILQLQTTHTPSFLGLHQNTGFWKQSNYGKGVIIGVLDTGITPDHPSFSDAGLPAPPAKWKGKCEFNTSACNNKLIGAKNFNINGSFPVDINGHGTHTASTAAGNYVKGANVLGNGNGTAAGIAPLAHLAIYQVCGNNGCPESGILAAADAAIDDGVNILSLSLGGPSRPFYSDNIAIGAYSAFKKGIFVSCAGGNNGAASSTLSNEAPWILTVGASTVDRKFRATAVLGNNVQLDGEALYQPRNLTSKQFPLYYPGLNQSDTSADRFCQGMIKLRDVLGKIVVCEAGLIEAQGQIQVLQDLGGVGLIIIDTKDSGFNSLVEPLVFPTTILGYADQRKLIAYMTSVSKPTAEISFRGTIIGDQHAPQVAYFSSRGPSRASPGILKPDIIGPGVNILAAWPKDSPITNDYYAIFNVISGTSMATPHLSGVAALLKSAHPDWSPAAIKSALLTTADVVNLAKKPIEDEKRIPATVFAVGSGHVNPSRANDPGLVYDIEPEDYIPYLCGGLNYTSVQVALIVQRKVDCAKESGISESQLNYPSFTVFFGSGSVQKYTRTVTNVGEANSVYTVKVVPPQGIKVTVAPRTLNFSKVNQKLKYEVTFTRSSDFNATSPGEGSLTWFSTKHNVRSPIAVGISQG